METKEQVIEVQEIVEETKSMETATPTRQELKEKGWTKAEMDAAEKRGMISKPEEGKKEEVEGKKTETVPEKKEEKKEDPAVDRRSGQALPDFTFKTPEQEKAWLDAFGPGTEQRAMYFRMKNERLTRQKAEQERDRLALELQMHKDAKLKLEDQPEVDENGNVIDPEEKPLTMRQLREMQKAEQDALNKQQEELRNRSTKVSEAFKVQEDYAKSILPDFDDTVKLAAELVQDLKLAPEPWKQKKVQKLIKDLQIAAATADQYDVEDYNASMIAYEIGQLHPKYGQKADPNGKTKVDPKANGSLTPEQMKRIEENTQRRTSSASLPGSSNGRRTISLDDLTIKDVLKMTPEERYKLKRDHPEKMAKLMRG
jgi:hypothetical protein